METNQIPRILDLVIYLSGNVPHTAQQYADMLGVTRRNIYNYLHLLEGYGLHIVKDGTRYAADRRSEFFKRLHENIPLTDTDAEYLCHVLAEAGADDPMAARLRSKLVRHFVLDDIAAGPDYMQRVNSNKAVLRQAMKNERIVRIIGYSSPHSDSVTDRYVEPFMFMSGGRDVRCHEIATHQNKTFKLSRMENVELMDDSWFNKQLHKQVYTDIFMFAGEQRHQVVLRLGRLSRNVMVEEYPLSESCIRPETDGKHWILDTEVVSFLGIGRFVMGLYEDIEILGCDKFREYVTDKIERMWIRKP